MRKSALFCAVWGLGLSAALAAETPRHTPNPKLTALAENTWQKVAGFAPAPGGILAYSGGSYDSVNHQFLIFGGGHADYWGNEVCAFSPETLTWKKMYEPDARGRYTNDNIDNANGRLKDSDKPYTRHSYNMLCFVASSASMFAYSGCGPGWGDIKPTCPAPPDAWSYSWKDNKWTQLANAGAPGGYAKACCYDSRRDTVWAYGGKGTALHQFDLKAKAWKAHAAKIPFGGINLQMEYLPKMDRVMIIGGRPGSTCTVNPEGMAVESHPLEDASGKAGLTWLPEQDAALYLTLPGGETGPAQRLAVFDCAKKEWREVACEMPKEMRGAIWDRLHFDPVDKVALLVVGSGVWAYRPPAKFAAAGPADAGKGPGNGK